MKEHINVDILLMVGGKGGLENSVNTACDYLVSQGCRVRFIQVVKTGADWYTSKASFHCLNSSEHIDIEECTRKYMDLISSDTAPDLIIVAGMPHMIYIAKRAIITLQLPIPIAAWPHNDLFYYDEISRTQDALGYAEFIFAISDKIANDAEKLCPDKIIYRVNNSINPENIVYSDTRNTSDFAFVGRLSPEKNVELIIKAIARSKCNLTIIGDGEEKESLMALSDKLNCHDRITFAGWNDAPWQLLTHHRALIMASSTEGSPLTCVEALACGMQVISTPVASVPELIIPDVTGFIYPYDSSDALANVINSLADVSFNQETAEKCKASIADFLPETALYDFKCKVVASANLKALPQRNWRDKSLIWCRQ